MAQTVPNSFFGFYYGFGTTVPVGSFSKNSSKYNNFGKAGAGLNIKAGVEYFIDEKNAISIDLDYGIFLNMSNDSLTKMVTRRVNSYPSPVLTKIEYDEFDLVLSSYCLGYSRLWHFNKIILQAKINVGFTKLNYEYESIYTLGTFGFSGVTSSTSISNVLEYTCSNDKFFIAKPEIEFKYIFSQKKNADWCIGLGAGYFYSNPQITVYEINNSYAQELLVLKDEIKSLSLNLKLSYILKKSIFD